MKKLSVLIIIMALLMCGCAPEVSAANDETADINASSPAAGTEMIPVAVPTPSPEPLSKEVQELLEVNEQIWIEKHLRPWMIGRLIIPEADINVAVFIHGEGADVSQMRQNVCDAEDSAIHYSDGVGNVIADHNNQGFMNLPLVELGDKAFLVCGDCILTLQCDLVTEGINTGDGITEEDGRWITADEDFTFYTCGEDWVNIKIAGFKELEENYFELETPSWLQDMEVQSNEPDEYMDEELVY